MPEPFVEVQDLKVLFPIRSMSLGSLCAKGRFVGAVDGVSFTLNRGEVFGLVGESGSGKTTLARTMLRLIDPTSGRVILDRVDVTALSKRELRSFRQRMQMIFQDASAALSRRYTTAQSVTEPLRVNRVGKPEERRERVIGQLEAVGLAPAARYLNVYPHRMSGGQQQRVAIARALVMEPSFLIADEPVASLDVAIRSEILNLLLTLRSERQLTVLYITHDIATARSLCDRIGVMYLGKLVEIGPAEKVTSEPYHPYARALLAATPVPDPRASRIRDIVQGEIPSATNPPSGCRFHPRCPQISGPCSMREPRLLPIDASGGRKVACHLYHDGDISQEVRD